MSRLITDEDGESVEGAELGRDFEKLLRTWLDTLDPEVHLTDLQHILVTSVNGEMSRRRLYRMRYRLVKRMKEQAPSENISPD